MHYMIANPHRVKVLVHTFCHLVKLIGMNFVSYTKINSAFIPNYLKNFFRTRIVNTFNILKSIFQNSLILAQAVYYHKYLHLPYINRMSILFNFSIFFSIFCIFYYCLSGSKKLLLLKVGYFHLLEIHRWALLP